MHPQYTDPDYLAALDLNIMGIEVSNTKLALGVAAVVGAFVLWRRNRSGLEGFWPTRRDQPDDFYDKEFDIRPGPWATKTAKRCVGYGRDRNNRMVCKKYGNVEVLASEKAYKHTQYRTYCKKYKKIGGRRRCVKYGHKYKNASEPRYY